MKDMFVICGIILIILILAAEAVGTAKDQRLEVDLARVELTKLEARLDVLEGMFRGCEAVAVHQTLREGWEMVQVLCPVGVGPRPEED